MIIRIVGDENSGIIDFQPILESYKMPDKLYGTMKNRAYRVWNDYVYNNRSTGVLLTGNKGSGKTLLATYLCNIAISFGLPVYIIDTKFPDKLLSKLIPIISNQLRECVVFIDEFGKLFNRDCQDSMLTMLSDINDTKKIFVLTENHDYYINQYIVDRPGRIKYHYEFMKIDLDVLEGYCIDNNVSYSLLEELKAKWESVNIFSFDQLQAIVNEHNKYPNDGLKDIISVLNVKSLKKQELYELVSVIEMETGNDVEFKPSRNVSKSALSDSTYRSTLTFHLKIPKEEVTIKETPIEPFGGLREVDNNGYTEYRYEYGEAIPGSNFPIFNKDTIVLKTDKYIIKWRLQK